MGSTQAWIELIAYGYAAYVAFFAGAVMILVYGILLAAGTSVADWIVARVSNGKGEGTGRSAFGCASE